MQHSYVWFGFCFELVGPESLMQMYEAAVAALGGPRYVVIS